MNDITFYIIKCKDSKIKESYIGSTQDFEKRKQAHKRNSLQSLYLIYRTIRENGYWDNWIMVSLFTINVNDIDRRKIETLMIKRLGTLTINSILPINLLSKSQRDHQSYLKHKRERLDKHKIYAEKNKETIKEWSKEWRILNRDYLRAKDKENSVDKTTCICGSNIITRNINNHYTTKKHQEYLKNN